MNLYAKQAIQHLHWTLENYDEADYYRLGEVMSAKESEERLVDPMTLL